MEETVLEGTKISRNLGKGVNEGANGKDERLTTAGEQESLLMEDTEQMLP